MAKSKPIPIKLSEDLIQQLDRVSASTGLHNRSSLIRLCLQSFLDYFDLYGEAALPMNWRDILAEMDGRRTRHHPQHALKAAEERALYSTRKKDSR